MSDPTKGGRPPRPRISTAFLLAQVGSHAASRFAARLEPLGLSRPHAGILNILGAEEGLTQHALGERLGILPSRLVLLIDELEERSLVERRDSTEDRRRYALYLTPKGRQALEAVGQVAREHNASICAALDEKERDLLTRLLARIAEDQGLTPGVHPGFKQLGRWHGGDTPRGRSPRE